MRRKSGDSTPKQQQQMPAEQPALNESIEALFASCQHVVDTQHEVMALKGEIGKLPALPDEGY